nr:VOC family protein [Clostridium pasteurianum]
MLGLGYVFFYPFFHVTLFHVNFSLFTVLTSDVKPVWPEEIGKQQKQMHFGFQVDDLLTAVLQAEALGACKAESQFGGNSFVTMFDPEGHPFCLSVK